MSLRSAPTSPSQSHVRTTLIGGPGDLSSFLQATGEANIVHLAGTAGGTSRAARTRPPAWPRSCVSTASGTGSSRVSYKQVKGKLGWADFQVRSDIAIGRHQVLVNCAFSFCWAAWFAHPPPPATPPGSRGRRRREGTRARQAVPAAVLAPGAAGRAPGWPRGSRCSAGGPPGRTRPRPAAASPDQLGRGRLRPAPLHPELTNCR
jgi:hypothetical protein